MEPVRMQRVRNRDRPIGDHDSGSFITEAIWVDLLAGWRRDGPIPVGHAEVGKGCQIAFLDIPIAEFRDSLTGIEVEDFLKEGEEGPVPGCK